MEKLYYPENFPKEKERLLVNLFNYLTKKEPKSIDQLLKTIRLFLKHKKEKRFFPAFWMINFVYWRHFFNKITKPKFLKLLQKAKIRSLSGIVPLSLFTKPEESCPYQCVYCPNEPGVPKSYFADEAAVMRAIRNRYDPFLQTRNRLIQFFLSGHPIDKVDVIIQGGTFSFYNRKYREALVKRIFEAGNSDIKKLIISGKERQSLSENLQRAKAKNETADQRVVGITIETRPDFINEAEILFLRELGVTRVELGVQTLDNQVLTLIKRGHTVDDIVKATKLLKEAGFKVTYHLMPGLPGSNLTKDIAVLKQVFSNQDFKPDAIKLYPTQVTKGTQLYRWFKQGRYQPMSEKELLTLVLKFKNEIVPRWVRVQRLVRDLTRDDLAVETFPSNFRQKLEKIMERKNIKCQCIRCREIRDKKIYGKINLKVLSYKASGGIEYFIEKVDSKNQLLGFLRLRVPEFFLKNQPFFINCLNKALIIRELHVYGRQVPLGKKGEIQHKGIGKDLVEKALDIAKSHQAEKIAVIAGVGVRQYFRRLGFYLKDEYMIKPL